MELAKVILKSLYMIVIFIPLYLIIKSKLDLSGMNLISIVFGVSVLIMYLTFNQIYEFLMTSEIVLQNKNEIEEQNNTGNTMHTSIEKKVHIDNKTSNEYTMDHTHKFVEKNIFN